jgi:hypothetical protein
MGGIWILVTIAHAVENGILAATQTRGENGERDSYEANATNCRPRKLTYAFSSNAAVSDGDPEA